MRRRFLVTGGCGFVGSHLVDALLAAGHRVRVLDDLSSGSLANLAPGTEFHHGSVTDSGLVRRTIDATDGCFHLAAIASVRRCEDEWAEAHTANQSGTVTVLDAARQAGGVPVVIASSAAVYGAAQDLPLAEHTAPQPLGPYGVDKLGSELHARIARTRFGVPTAGLRFFNVYGPRQDGRSAYSGVISIFREQIARGAPLTLRGDGSQTRDFIYVADVIAALRAAMQALPATPPVLNVCSGQATSIRSLAETIAGISGRKLRLRHLPAPGGEIVHSCGDPSLLAASLGVRARIGLAEGLARTLSAREIRRGAA